MALSEPCPNAICHGSPHGCRDHFHVTCCLSAEELVMEVADEGAGFKAEPVRSLPDESSVSGRGIYLMEQFCDSLKVERRPRGTAVTMVKRLRPEAARAGPGEAPDYHASAYPSRRGSLPPTSTPVRASC